MTQAFTAAVLLTAMLLSGSLLVVWSRRRTWLRAGAIPIAVLSGLVSAIALFGTLGFAVPLIPGVTAPEGKVGILSQKMIPNEGIYLTLDLPTPRLFWLPWDSEMAENLQEMEGDPANGGVVAIIPPFEFSWDLHGPSFQPLPQPKVFPDKPVDEAPSAPSFAA